MAPRKKKDPGAAESAPKEARAAPGEAAEAEDGPAGGVRELTREDVAQRLLELYRRCLRAERVMTYDKDEKQWMLSDEWKVDARGAAPGAELRLSEEAAELAE